MMNKIKKIPAVIIAAVLFVSVALGSVSAVTEIDESTSFFSMLTPEIDELIELYVEYSLYELDKEEAIRTMIKNFVNDYPEIAPYMIDSLLTAFDDFGGYYSNTSISSLFGTSTYSGYGIIIIGEIIINARRYNPVIQHVIRNSPAESAGLKAGDIFVAINDINIERLGVDALSDFLSATTGQTKFTVKRGDEEFDVEMSKASVKYESVSYRILDESQKLALLTIADFLDDSLPLEMSAILGVLDEQGYKNLIVDLRNNTGGNLEFLYTTLDYFVPEENIQIGVIETNKDEKEYIYSTDFGFDFEKICILTNEYTASAAEAFALSLSELTDSLIIGGTTYGKGIGQTYFELTNGDIIGITSLEIASPNGNKYHGEGITPHISVKMNYTYVETPVREEKFEQLNFVNCVSIKADADNKAVLGLNQRLSRIGYLMPDDVTSECTQKTITAVEIFQNYYGLEKGIDKIDYLFLEYLSYVVTYSPTIAVDGDVQLDCAVKFMLEGEQAARVFAESIYVEESEESEESEAE